MTRRNDFNIKLKNALESVSEQLDSAFIQSGGDIAENDFKTESTILPSKIQKALDLQKIRCISESTMSCRLFLSFNDFIRTMRAKASLTIKSLANLLGLTENEIDSLECGQIIIESMDIHQIVSIMSILNLPLRFMRQLAINSTRSNCNPLNHSAYNLTSNGIAGAINLAGNVPKNYISGRYLEELKNAIQEAKLDHLLQDEP